MKKTISFIGILFTLIALNGCSGMQNAIMNNDITKVQKLLNEGEDVNQEGGLNRTPLHQASMTGKFEIVKLLVENGAIIDKVDKSGRSALLWASSRGHLEISKYLVSKGANINRVDNFKHSILDDASFHGTPEVVSFLISKNVNLKNEKALISASSKGNLKIVKLLVDAGIDLNTQNIYGYTALSIAAAKMHNNIVDFLVKNCANPYIKNSKGLDAIHYNNNIKKPKHCSY